MIFFYGDFLGFSGNFTVIFIGIESEWDIAAMALLDRSLTELWFGGDVP